MKISQLIDLLKKYKKEIGDVDAAEALYGTTLGAKLQFGLKTNFYQKGITNDLTFNSWTAMHKRCFDTNHIHYKRYGGSGIGICFRWLKYENFLADMGERPSKGMSLDRIDNTKDYSPENCRWATEKEQQNNKTRHIRVNLPEFSGNLTKACEHFKVSYAVVLKRVQRGRTPEDALLMDIKPRKRSAS